VPRHERLLDQGLTDPAILVVVQVTAAQPDGRDLEKNLAGTTFSQIERGDARVASAVQVKGAGHDLAPDPVYICISRLTDAIVKSR
jgi:hypothetical protein